MRISQYSANTSLVYRPSAALSAIELRVQLITKSPEGRSIGSPFASSLKELLSRIVKLLLSDMTVLF